MIIMISLFLIAVMFGTVGYFLCDGNFDREGNPNNQGGLGIISWVLSVLFTFSFLFCSLGLPFQFLKKDIYRQELLNDKSKLTRLLNEDYNPINLERAINFNNDQKIIKVENESMVWKYWHQVVFVDTIEIPNGKFMPAQKIILNKEQ